MDQHKPKITPKDFFLWVATMATLYVSAVSLLTLLFQYINVYFRDSTQFYYDPYSGAIRFAIASLIIIFPLYLYLTRKLNQDIRKHTDKKDLSLRKWLIFFTLFVAGVTIIVDLIVLISTFLGGEEITTAFILKIVSILVVIGGVFMYYLYDLRGVWEKKQKESQTIGMVVSVLVLVAIVSGFFIIGSPQTQRLIRIDQQKVQDLSSIQWQIINFYQQKERLPQDLKELEDPLIGFILPEDSQHGTPYTYSRTGSLSFELCGVFNVESKNYSEVVTKPNSVQSPIESSIRYGFEDVNWAHKVGEECFARTIDPDKFPPLKR